MAFAPFAIKITSTQLLIATMAFIIIAYKKVGATKMCVLSANSPEVYRVQKFIAKNADSSTNNLSLRLKYLIME
jgi:hypothetical protein